jgi:hypothetical protein
MKYIVATSDSPYFRWQMLVQINNFKKLGILEDLIYVVSIEKRRSAKLNKIIKETGVKVFTYKDTRQDKFYPPSITAHVMAKFLDENPEYGKCFFYLDPDVVFTKKPEWNATHILSPTWYLSNTVSYIGSSYIRGKSEELFNEMCYVVGVDPNTIKAFQKNSGGAQYIIKNVDAKFWKKVEIDSNRLYQLMEETKETYAPKPSIQTWTAEMWALLWNAIYFKHNVRVIDEMDFIWATDPIGKWGSAFMLHNAGVHNEDFLFNKGKFANKHPFNEDFSYVTNERCSIKYVDEILDTKKNYSDLIKKL